MKKIIFQFVMLFAYSVYGLQESDLLTEEKYAGKISSLFGIFSRECIVSIKKYKDNEYGTPVRVSYSVPERKFSKIFDGYQQSSNQQSRVEKYSIIARGLDSVDTLECLRRGYNCLRSLNLDLSYDENGKLKKSEYYLETFDIDGTVHDKVSYRLCEMNE